MSNRERMYTRVGRIRLVGMVLALVMMGAGTARADSMALGTTARISKSLAGAQGDAPSEAPSVSADGAIVAFESRASNLVDDDTNALSDIFVKSMADGSLRRISRGLDGSETNGGSGGPKVSRDGHFVIFTSSASNIVPGDTNERSDVFVYDRTSEIGRAHV